MLEPRRRARLAQEARAKPLVASELGGQQLDCHQPVEKYVPR